MAEKGAEIWEESESDHVLVESVGGVTEPSNRRFPDEYSLLSLRKFLCPSRRFFQIWDMSAHLNEESNLIGSL